MEVLEYIVKGIIEDIGFDEENDCYCLIIRKDGIFYNAWIMADAEGTGPGALHVEEVR